MSILLNAVLRASGASQGVALLFTLIALRAVTWARPLLPGERHMCAGLGGYRITSIHSGASAMGAHQIDAPKDQAYNRDDTGSR